MSGIEERAFRLEGEDGARVAACAGRSQLPPVQYCKSLTAWENIRCDIETSSNR